ncbi:MAG TPA: YkgJ family cysteine cluster protein [Pyrinomonadaceae bacterium]|jgi:Fe-S-cluster containining protein|nr:YkgJ family cysteine cluster protein [Pyrinomonadaceae bacterium]
MKKDQGTTQKQSKSYYNCTKCPAYCCSIYERVQVTKRDIKRLGKYFRVDYETAKKRYTTKWQGEQILKRKADPIFGEACKFLDPVARRCTIYEGRPEVCREFPARTRCAYYDLLRFERSQQGDESVLPLVQIMFRNGDK